jgi:integral membrane sensor domain MASE1
LYRLATFARYRFVVVHDMMRTSGSWSSTSWTWGERRDAVRSRERVEVRAGWAAGRGEGSAMRVRARTGWPTWRVVSVVAVAYAAGALLVFGAFGATAIVVLFLPAGVTVSALVLTTRRQWPWILATVALVEIVVDLSQGLDPRFVGGFALANTAEPVVGALLLRRVLPGKVDLLRRRDLAAFVTCCVLAGPSVGALIGGTTISVSQHWGWAESFLPYWAGDATGVLTVGGCVLAWRHRPAPTPAWLARWATAVVGTAALTVAAFWPVHLPLFYLPIPVLFWLAFGQPLAITLTSGLAMTVTANVMTSAGHGPWTVLQSPVPSKTATLELFLAVAVLGAWFLAVGVAERDVARQATSMERAARQRLHAVQQMTLRVAMAATSQAIAETVVHDSVTLFADHATLAVVSPDDDEVWIWTATGPAPDLVDAGLRAPRSSGMPLAHVIRTGSPVAFQDLDELALGFPAVADAYRRRGVHSGICLPVTDGIGPPLGGLDLGFGRDGAVDADAVMLAKTVAGLTGQALRRAQSYERELGAAHKLQHALLPVLASGEAGVRVSAQYRPAERWHEVGGDWYDVFTLPNDRIGLVVGDVAGHDLAAAAAMARVQSALRVLAQVATGPADVLQNLDRASALLTNSFMSTVGFAEYDPATRTLRYACAGHPPPLLLTTDGPRYLWGGRSAPLGVPGPRTQAECVVPADSTLVWYTDGLVERRDVPLSVCLDRLADVAATLATLEPEQLCHELLRHMLDDAGNDDTVVLCIGFAPSAVAAPHPRKPAAGAPATDSAGSQHE